MRAGRLVAPRLLIRCHGGGGEFPALRTTMMDLTLMDRALMDETLID